MLAGISAEYYLRLERGRAQHPSSQILDALARALASGLPNRSCLRGCRNWRYRYGYGSYFPDWLLERRKRAEQALTTVVATCYLLGVSTRRMDKLVETLGITSLSKSQVSVMADTSLPAEGTRVARCSEICIRLASRQPRIRTH